MTNRSSARTAVPRAGGEGAAQRGRGLGAAHRGAPGGRCDRKGVDWIDCSVWGGRLRRSVAGWGTGDVVEVQGALRRRFYRVAGGRDAREWRSRPAAAGSSVAQIPHEHAHVRLRLEGGGLLGEQLSRAGRLATWSNVGAGSSTASPCPARPVPRQRCGGTPAGPHAPARRAAGSRARRSPASGDGAARAQRRPVLPVMQHDRVLELGERLVAAPVPAEVVAACLGDPLDARSASAGGSSGGSRTAGVGCRPGRSASPGSGPSRCPGAAPAAVRRRRTGGARPRSPSGHRSAPSSSVACTSGSVIRQIRWSWSAAVGVDQVGCGGGGGPEQCRGPRPDRGA